MMQLGSHNVGARSSILSPLAPPFTIDEPNSNHPHEFPEFQPNINSLSDSLNLAASDRYGGSPYEQHSNSAPSSNDDAKPYYPPYIAVEDADSVPGNDTSDDLLANSGSGKSGGSVQVDLELSRVWHGMSNEEKRNWLKNLGGSFVPQDYKPPPPPIPEFSGVWNRMSIEEQCESLRYFGGRFGPQGYKHAQNDPEVSHLRNGLSLEQRNSLNSDGSCVSKPAQPDLEWSHSHGWNGVTNTVQHMSLESFGPQVDLKRSRNWNNMSDVGQGKSLNKLLVSSTGHMRIKKESYVETPVTSKNCSGGSGSCLQLADHKTFNEPNHGTATGSCIPLAAMGPTSSCNKNRHLQDSSFQAQPIGPIPKCYGLYESPLDTQDKHAKNNDSYFLDSASTMRSSPENPFRITFGGFPSQQDASLSDFLPYHPFGLNFQGRSDARNADNLLTRSPSPKRDNNVKYRQGNEDRLDQVVHAKYAPSSPQLSVAGCLQKRSDMGFSKEILSKGPQIQNPAVESPCSKGALAARFSPVEDSKLVHPDDVLEKLEVHFKQCSDEHNKIPSGLHINETMHASEEANENNSSIKSSDANNICKVCASRLKFHTGMKLYPGDGFGSLEKKNGLDDALENEPSIMEYSGVASSSTSLQSLQINLVDHEPVPIEKNYELKGECVDLAASRRLSCSTTNVNDDFLHSPSENLSASKVHQFGKDLHSKVDMGMLINTMKTLSEVLVDHCLSSGLSSDIRSAELYNVALKDIIINLNSCLVKEIDQVTQMEKAVDPQQGTRSLGDAQQSPMVRKITTTNTDPHGFDILGDVQHLTFSSRNEGVLDSSFLKDDAETVKDVDTIQAIKRVLHMKFPSDELHPETVLYKNLWLEAEASLCATNVTSRFKSLQKEMEIRDYHRMNDEENIPNPEACAVNEISEPLIQAVNSLDSSKLNCPANMESSVVARFQNLRSVVEDLKPPNSKVNHIETLPSPSATPQSNANDIEASLKYRTDNLESLNTEDGKVPSGNSETPPSSNPSRDSCFSSIYGHMDYPKASVMSRFNILKSWTGHPDSLLHMDAHQLPEPVDEATLSSSIYAQNRSSDDVQSEGEGVEDCSGGSVAYNPGNDKFFEEWEHVYKEAFP